MVNKNVFLGVGHGGADSGAVGYVREETINLKMALACRDYLESEYVGVTVKMSRTKDENDPLTEEIRECNKFITKKSEGVAVDIHNNAGGGDGFEAYYSVSGGTGKTLAKNIEKEIKKVGQNSRGCKTRANKSGSDYYGFIRQTIAPAVITECVFVDNKKDAAQADTDKECKEFGEAIAKGIAATLGLEKKKKASKPAAGGKEFQVKVKCNLNVRAGAGTDKKKVDVITDRGVYTIVETKKGKGGTFGKLKSGAGWICIISDYVTRV